MLLLALLGALCVLVVVVAVSARNRVRTTPVYATPVLAGQPFQCTAGFYARRGETLVLLLSAHCYDRANPPRDASGDVIGTYGADARREPCPPGRTCAGSDVVELVLEPDHIPWGHLNEVDLGAGGYRVIPPGTSPMSCDDIRANMSVETNGRGIYRTGTVIGVEPYNFDTDTIFPCMAVTTIEAGIGDSGGAMLIDGRPAGIASRELGGRLGFTPLAEGLQDLGLELCTEPDCGLTPPSP